MCEGHQRFTNFSEVFWVVIEAASHVHDGSQISQLLHMLRVRFHFAISARRFHERFR